MPSIFLSRTSSAIFSIIVDLFTWNGISVTMMASRIAASLDMQRPRIMTGRGRLIGLANALSAENDAAGREVRTRQTV